MNMKLFLHFTTTLVLAFLLSGQLLFSQTETAAAQAKTDAAQSAASETLASGSINSSISWSVSSDGVLTLSGSGEFPADGRDKIDSSVEYTGLVVGEGITGIAAKAFKGCENLKEVQISPSAATKIGKRAFAGCTSLTDVTLPESDSCFQRIGAEAFAGCTSLVNVTLGDGFIFYEGSTGIFKNCTSLTNIKIPGSASYLPQYAFAGCSALKDVTFQVSGTDSLVKIDEYAFYNCTGLTDIVLPEGTQEIGNNAFKGCTALESLSAPVTLKTIHKDSFVTDAENEIYYVKKYTYSAAWLKNHGKTIQYSGLPSGSTTGITWNISDEQVLTINATEKTAYVSGEAWENCYFKKLVIGEGIAGIEESAFEESRSLERVTLPDTLKNIGFMAFASCEKLKTVQMGSHVSSIGEEAFFGCKSLTEIEIPGGVKTLPEAVFADCTSLTKVVIRNGVKKIRWYAFENCVSLENITIPESTTSVDLSAFRGCSSLSVFMFAGKTVSLNTGNGSFPLGKKTILYGKHGSDIEKLAYKGGYRFRVKNGAAVKTRYYTYNGKKKKPGVVVTDSNGKVISSSKYRVTYPSGCIKRGNYKVKITFRKGSGYKGTRTAVFTIR